MPRNELTMAERIEICRHHEAGRITNKALSVWASERMGKSTSEMTISRLLKRKSESRGSNVAKNRKPVRKPECSLANLESPEHGEGASAEITEDVLDRIKALKALISVLMLEKVWRIDVTVKTVKKCWIHLKLVRDDEILPDFNSSWEVPELNITVISDGTRELREALQKLEEVITDSGNSDLHEELDPDDDGE
ncbi:hypothetical protein R1sor_016967 [Riccia sorocarpa]|uniref:Transposase n=1 Tax=Riccia sorocarpa TaxID=122646 RepID=A0ABD3I983_9MARC